MKNRPPNKLNLGPLNTNSLRNKFDSLKNYQQKNRYSFTFETKLDGSSGQFEIMDSELRLDLIGRTKGVCF